MISTLLVIGLFGSEFALAQTNPNSWRQYQCTGQSKSSTGGNVIEQNGAAIMNFAYNYTVNAVRIVGWDRFTENGIVISKDNEVYGRNIVRISTQTVTGIFKHSGGTLSYELTFDVAKSTVSVAFVANRMNSIFVGRCTTDRWMDTGVTGTSKRREARANADRQYYDKSFSDQSLAKGVGWYVVNSSDYTYETTKNSFRKIDRNEKVALFELQLWGGGWRIGYGPYATHAEAKRKHQELIANRQEFGHMRVINVVAEDILRIETLQGTSGQVSAAASPSVDDKAAILNKIAAINLPFFKTLGSLATYAEQNILADPSGVHAEIRGFQNSLLKPSDTTGAYANFSDGKISSERAVLDARSRFTPTEFHSWISKKVSSDVDKFNMLMTERNALLAQYNK